MRQNKKRRREAPLLSYRPHSGLEELIAKLFAVRIVHAGNGAGRLLGVTLGHEAVELFAVLGTAQFTRILFKLATHFIELAALLVEALQLLFTPFVKGDIAGSKRTSAEMVRTPVAAERSTEIVCRVLISLLKPPKRLPQTM